MTAHFLEVAFGDDRSKIRRTVTRIKAYGRDPKQLTYCSSLVVPEIDGDEDLLTDELGVTIRIRDQKYILSHINHSDQTVEAFNSYLAPHLAFLKEIGGTTIISQSKDLPARALCVFLGQEIDHRRGNTELLEAVTGSLILWALEGTDPDKKVFRTRAELLGRIVEALPAANQFIKGVLDSRLEALASKSNTSGREVRWYRGDDHFCLPFETRRIVEEENTEDEVLKVSVSEVFNKRAVTILKDGNQAALVPKTVALCHRAVEITFEKQGLELAFFLEGGGDTEFHNTISDHIDTAMDEFIITSAATRWSC